MIKHSDKDNSKIFLSVDMDEWYQCRWATGSDFALWPDTKTFFRDYYNTDEPIGEIIPLTEKILALFDEYSIKATFFFTGQIACYYPDLVKEIAQNGHEIASHNMVHKDYNENNRMEFFHNLKKSKKTLHALSGQKIIGYRAPNAIVRNYMINNLLELDFRYDSSISPSWLGKYRHHQYAQRNPYMTSHTDFIEPGDSGLWEIPWPIFPYLKTPSGSGIMSRIAGYRYITYSLDSALQTGHTSYYFHPYEIGMKPQLNRMNFRTKLFLKNLGEPYYVILCKILKRYRGKFFNGEALIKLLEVSDFDSEGSV